MIENQTSILPRASTLIKFAAKTNAFKESMFDEKSA